MSDAPQGSGRGDAASGSAPWERPQSWSSQPSEPTRVDELLSRLSADDEVGRRSRRRAAGDAEQTVAASDLIAALQSSSVPQSIESSAAPEAQDATPGAEGGTPGGQDAEATIAVDPDGEATQLIPTTATTGAAGAAATGTSIAGAADRARASGDDAEATVLLPRYSEDPAAILESLRRRSRDELPPTDPPTQPPAGTGGNGGDDGHAHRRRRGWLYAGRSVIAAIAAGLLLFTGMEYSVLQTTNAALQDKQVEALDTNDTHIKTPTATGTKKATGTNAAGETTAAAAVYQAENILLLGSDTRANGNAGPGVGSENDTDSAQSDTLLVAHISADRQHITIVSIPRDLHIEAPLCKTWDYKTGKLSDYEQGGDGSTWKITNAYAVGGPKCTVKAVQQLTGMRIDRLIGIDFAGFKTMVDALGGIKVDVCKPIVDNELGTVVPKAGVQTLKGDQALSFVRARKVQGDPTGDLGRIRRQQVVLSAMLRQVVSAGTLLNPSKLQNFLEAFTDSTYTQNVTVDSLIDLAKSLGSLDPQKVTFYTVPTVTDPNDPDALALDPKANAVFDALVNDQTLPGEPTVVTTSSKTRSTATRSSAVTTTKKSATPTLTVSPADVDLELVNVAGRAGVAGEAQTALNAIGFDISNDDLTLPDDQPVYSDITVLYAPENKAAALTVAAAVPGAILEAQEGLGSRVRLLLGSSYTGTVTEVKAGDPVPTSLRSAASATDSAAATSTSEPDAGSATRSTGTGSTLASTDLSSVNAAQTGCA